VRPWFELAPLPGFESLAAALTAAGAAQFGVHGAFYGRPSGGSIAAPSAPGVEVRPVAPGDIDRFGETLLRGFGVPEFVLRQEVETVRHWTDLSGWFLLEANVDGEPAGGAVLTVPDGVAYLAYASTLPAFRGRGVQSALLAERLRLAAEAGCDLVVSLAEFDSPSARNLQRVGLRLAYLLSRWRLGGADEPPPTDRAKEPSREEVGP
jgi:GNAT superfamily N-acetyltransferase